MNNHETFEDIKFDVRKRVQDAIEDAKTSHYIVDGLTRDELNEQLQPFISGVVETLQAKLIPHID
jgi:hypothetical protein